MRKSRYPWVWVPSLYFAEGLPQVIIAELSVLMYQQLGLGNALIAFYTSWFYLPWVLKPLWSPFIDLLKTKRWWILTMEAFLGAAFAGLAFTIPTGIWWQSSICLLWVAAFSSTTHDIAADGLYIKGLDDRAQSLFLFIRNAFYQVASLVGKGILIWLAGFVQVIYRGQIRYSWSIVFYAITGIFMALWLYHYYILPRHVDDLAERHVSWLRKVDEVMNAFTSFFKQQNATTSVLFMLLYFLPSALLSKIQILFLRDFTHSGGLGLSPQEFSFAYGTIGVVGMLAGTVIGGMLVRRNGLKRWLWFMTLAMTLTNAVYLLLSYQNISDLRLISLLILIQQTGFGFGFCALTFSLTLFSGGRFRTVHYSICSGFMATSLMIPGLFSGVLQAELGYRRFFILVLVASIATFVVTALVHMPSEFGKRQQG